MRIKQPRFVRQLTNQLPIVLLIVFMGYGTPALSGEAATGTAKSDIDLLLLNWINAELHHDPVSLDKLLDDRFLATFDDRKTIGKKDYLKGLTSGPVDSTERQEINDENFIVDGDMAVAIVMNTLYGTKDGKPYLIKLRATLTFVKRHGEWVALALHGSILK